MALVSNDALGNFVVTTPLLQMLRERFRPESLIVFGGSRTAELGENSDLIDRFVPLHGMPPREFAQAHGGDDFDLVVNVEQTAWAKAATAILCGEDTLVCGPCIDERGRADLPFPDDERGELWRDQTWIAPDLATRYPFLSSGFIGEIFARLAYLEGPVPPYRVPQAGPGRAIPDLLIATSASLPEKLWPLASWQAVLSTLREDGISVGLIGAPPRSQKAHWQGGDAEDELISQGLCEDLRGQFTLPQVVGALGACRAVLTLDNGILHLAAATSTPTVGLFREGIHRLWAPLHGDVRVVTGAPVADIPPERVLAPLLEVLGVH